MSRHDDSDVRVEAARGISAVAATRPDLVAPRLPDAIGLLHSHDLGVRTFGQDVIRELGTGRPEVLEGTTAAYHLAQGLTDEDEFVRMNPAETLDIVGGAAPDLFGHPGVVDALVANVAGDAREATRGHAAQSFERIANADPSLIGDRTVERLRAVVERDDVGGRIEPVVEGIETARRNRAGNAGDGAGTEFCPACGAELDADPAPNFCRNCGREL